MNNTGDSVGQSLITAGLFATALVFVLLLGLFGNIVVLCVIYHQRKNVRQRVTNTLLANLAFIDLLVPTLLIPFSLTVLLEGRHILTYSVCQFNGFVGNLSGAASILTMAVIGIDRYLAIVSPCGRRLQHRHVLFLLFGVWLISIVISLFPIIFWGDYKATKKSTACKSDNVSFLVLLTIVCFIIPLATMIFCYTKVFLKVRHHSKLVGSIKTKKQGIKTEYKTTKIVFVVLTTFIIAWTPFVIVYIISSEKVGVTIPPAVFQFFGILSAAHSMCNPIIYFTMNKTFRRDALSMLPCWKQRAELEINRDQPGTQSTSNPEKRTTPLTHGMLSLERLNKDYYGKNLEVIPLD